MLTKQEVTAIQSALREAGFLYKEPDGVWDLHTMQGYRNYLAVKLCAPNSQYISQPTSMDLVPDVLKGGVVADNDNSQEHNGAGGELTSGGEPNGNEPPAPEITEQTQVEQPTESNSPEVEQPEVEQPIESEEPNGSKPNGSEPTSPEQPEVEQSESEEPAGKPNRTKRSKTQSN